MLSLVITITLAVLIQHCGDGDFFLRGVSIAGVRSLDDCYEELLVATEFVTRNAEDTVVLAI